jgi:tripartite-type tricarboxylate transporter receptor subunit TctC
MRVLALLALSLVLVGPAAAQPFPAKPLRLFVGFSPGGGVDITGRIVAAKLSELWGQAITVENRLGAGGTLAADAVAKAPADGYTFVVCNAASHGIAPSLYKKLPYDPIRDFTPISLLGITSNVMVVHPSVPATTVAEFIAYAKANPGRISFGSSGIGTSPHLSVELLKSMTGINLVHVPYKGGAQSSTDLLSGQIQLLITNLPEQIGYIKAGKTRALGVSTTKRSPQLPDLPTISEAGVPGFDVTVWYGLCAPAGLPRALVDKVNADVAKAVLSPDTRQRLFDQGVEASRNSPEEFAAFIRAEVTKWAKVVRDSGATAD